METYLSFTDKDGRTREAAMEEVEKALGLEGTVAVRLGMRRGHVEMHAQVSPMEEDHPGIDVDTEISGHPVYLGNFELPCSEYPDRVAARLYAGHIAYETDEPIAVVTHDVTDEGLLKERAARYGGGHGHMHKLVYVNGPLAEAREWVKAGQDAMPEHKEDER